MKGDGLQNASQRVIVYGRNWCGYCTMAKRLLDRRGVSYEEVNLDERPELTGDVIARCGGRMTVPQIFIGGHSIGGYQELVALDRSGGLDLLLAAGD